MTVSEHSASRRTALPSAVVCNDRTHYLFTYTRRQHPLYCSRWCRVLSTRDLHAELDSPLSPLSYGPCSSSPVIKSRRVGYTHGHKSGSSCQHNFFIFRNFRIVYQHLNTPALFIFFDVMMNKPQLCFRRRACGERVVLSICARICISEASARAIYLAALRLLMQTIPHLTQEFELEMFQKEEKVPIHTARVFKQNGRIRRCIV